MERAWGDLKTVKKYVRRFIVAERGGEISIPAH